MSVGSYLHLNTKDAVSFNGNVATFIVDWDTILHGRTNGKCRVHYKMRSEIMDYFSPNKKQGMTLNATFQSNHSNNTNGLVLAPIIQKQVNSNSFYYYSESKQKQAPTISTPMGKGMFNVIFNV